MCAQPLKEGRNFFDLFGLKTEYPLDFSELERRYRRLQQSVHPDRFVNAPASEKLLATQRAGLFNQGFQTLRSPVERARHLLECRGVEMQAEESRSFAAGGEPGEGAEGGEDGARQGANGSDAEFLFHQMELRERLEALRGARDRPGLQALHEQTDREFSEWERQFSEAMHKNELEQGLRWFRRMQFTDRHAQEVRRTLGETEN